jgi:putative transposase
MLVKRYYLVYDGALGNNGGVQAIRKNGLHLISKLKNNSALYFPYRGEQKRVGTRRIYEKDKIDLDNIDKQYLKVIIENKEKGIKEEIYGSPSPSVSH